MKKLILLFLASGLFLNFAQAINLDIENTEWGADVFSKKNGAAKYNIKIGSLDPMYPFIDRNNGDNPPIKPSKDTSVLTISPQGQNKIEEKGNTVFTKDGGIGFVGKDTQYRIVPFEKKGGIIYIHLCVDAPAGSDGCIKLDKIQKLK